MNLNCEIKDAELNKGLGLFAAKKLEPNEIIFEEKPIIAAQFHWNEAYGYAACHHCLKPMESTEENIRRLTNNESLCLPHPELCPTDKNGHVYCNECGIGFCSNICKELSLKEYHKTLCKANVPSLHKLVDDWKAIHYPPETTSIMLLAKLIGLIEQAEDKGEATSTFLEFAHSCVNENEGLLMKFLGPKHADALNKIHSDLHELLPTGFVQSFVTEDGLKKMFALIGRNGQGIGTSVFSEWVKKVENLELCLEETNIIDNFIDKVYQGMNEHVGTFLNCEGSGLYKLQRIVNHSCTPNASVTFPYSNSTLVLVANKAIAAGEEICISYLDECTLQRSRHSRQSALREYYLFDCQCEKCIQQADDPDVTSEDDSDSDEQMEL